MWLEYSLSSPYETLTCSSLLLLLLSAERPSLRRIRKLALLDDPLHVRLELLVLDLAAPAAFDFLHESLPLAVPNDDIRARSESLLELLRADPARVLGEEGEDLLQVVLLDDDVAIKRGLQELGEVDLSIASFVDGTEDARDVLLADVELRADPGHRVVKLDFIKRASFVMICALEDAPEHSL